MASASSPIFVPVASSSTLSQRNLRSSLPCQGSQLSSSSSKLAEHQTDFYSVPSESCQINGYQLIKSGWIYKRSKRKTWNRRWFVLRGNQLIYYKDEREYKPRDIIAVEDIMAVAMLTDEHKPNHFAFFTPSKNYHLRADTISDAQSWVAELREVIDCAADRVLSSSFQRLSVLEATNKQQQKQPQQQPLPSKLNPSYRHSFNPALLNNRNGNNTGQKQRSNSATTLDAKNNNSLAFTRRQTINLRKAGSASSNVDERETGTKVAATTANSNLTTALTNSANNNTVDDDSPSKVLIKSQGSNSLQGSSRSEYMSSLMSTTDDAQSSLGSHNELLSDDIGPTTKQAPPPVSENNEHLATCPVEPAAGESLVATPPIPPTRADNAEEEEDEEAEEDEEEGKEPAAYLEKEQTLETGYLMRRKKRYNQWRKVWVVLTNKRVLLYKNEKSKNPSKIINLDHIIDVMELDAISRSKQYCMQVILPEKRLQFAAISEEDLTRWLASLKANIDTAQQFPLAAGDPSSKK